MLTPPSDVSGSLLISWHPDIRHCHHLSSRCSVILCVSSRPVPVWSSDSLLPLAPPCHRFATHPHRLSPPNLCWFSSWIFHHPQHDISLKLTFNQCLHSVEDSSSRCCNTTPQVFLSYLINIHHPYWQALVLYCLNESEVALCVRVNSSSLWFFYLVMHSHVRTPALRLQRKGAQKSLSINLKKKRQNMKRGEWWQVFIPAVL